MSTTGTQTIQSKPATDLAQPTPFMNLSEPPRAGPVLVPLDGSALSESALAWAAPLAVQRGATLLLVRAVELWSVPEEAPFSPMPVPPWPAGAAEAEEAQVEGYLEQHAVALKARYPSLRVVTEIMEGDPASSLLEVEERRRVQLVVMTTHSRSGVARLVRGSVAEHVLRHGAAPILLVRPHDDPAQAFKQATKTAQPGVCVLVPLDGSPLATRALPEALRLTTTPQGEPSGEIVLFTAIEIVPLAASPAPEVVRNVARGEATAYLETVAAQLRERGARVRCATLFTDDAAKAIVDEAVLSAADLVVMSTHGRSSLGRLFYGSVTDAVAHAACVPVLLFRPDDERPHGRPVMKGAAFERARAFQAPVN